MSKRDSRLRDISDQSYQPEAESPSANVRTQIRLSEEQRDFLPRESHRTGHSLTELIRSFIEEKMTPSESIRTATPLLAATPNDPDFEGSEDGSENTDAILYGSVAE